MRDIAKAAGVSAMTVSYALRHHPRIPESTAERVRRIAFDLGYVFNPLVSAFVTEIRHRKTMKSPPSIVYINMYKRRDIWRDTPFHGAQFEGAQSRCRQLDFKMDLVEPTISGLSGKRLTDVLLYNNCCGIIIAAMPVTGMALDIEWDRFSCVVMGHTMHGPNLHRVEINHYQGMLDAFARLVDLGYQRIALATFHQSSSRIRDQYVAAAEVFQRKQPPSHRVPILISSPSHMTPTKLKQWIDRHRPDILVDAGQRRYGTLLQEAGIKIPHDIAYTVSNWTPACEGLAGINQHPFRAGETAVDVIARQIHAKQRGIPTCPTLTLFDSSWVDGGSAPPVI